MQIVYFLPLKLIQGLQLASPRGRVSTPESATCRQKSVLQFCIFKTVLEGWGWGWGGRRDAQGEKNPARLFADMPPNGARWSFDTFVIGEKPARGASVQTPVWQRSGRIWGKECLNHLRVESATRAIRTGDPTDPTPGCPRKRSAGPANGQSLGWRRSRIWAPEK